MLLGLVLGASGCGTPEESAPTRDSDPASATPAAAADPDPRQAWLLSESRLVNRACAAREDAGGHPWELAWRWTSVQQPAAFAVQYQECKVNGLNERECISGSL